MTDGFLVADSRVNRTVTTAHLTRLLIITTRTRKKFRAESLYDGIDDGKIVDDVCSDVLGRQARGDTTRVERFLRTQISPTGGVVVRRFTIVFRPDPTRGFVVYK